MTTTAATLTTNGSKPNPTDRKVEPRRLYDLSPGYGIVRINPENGDAVIEAWPRWLDPDDDARQFEGWPHFVPSGTDP